MDAFQFKERDTCDMVCIRGWLEFNGEGRVGHLHWHCRGCGFMEATLPADESGYDRWKQ